MKNEWYDFMEAIVLEEVKKLEWYAVFEKVTQIINYVWVNFSSLLGWELAELKFKLSWYKYFLSDFVGELQRLSRFYSLDIESQCNNIILEESDRVRKLLGKISWIEREEIKDRAKDSLYNLSCKQLLYENYYYKYKVKMSAIDDVITTITQRISDLKRQMDNWI